MAGQADLTGETISLPGRLSHKPFWNPRFYLQMIFTVVQEFNRKNNELKPRVGLSQIGLSCHCERRWERAAPRPFWPNCLSSGRGWLSYCLRCFRPPALAWSSSSIFTWAQRAQLQRGGVSFSACLQSTGLAFWGLQRAVATLGNFRESKGGTLSLPPFLPPPLHLSLLPFLFILILSVPLLQLEVYPKTLSVQVCTCES